jgi:hypothetical protein
MLDAWDSHRCRWWEGRRLANVLLAGTHASPFLTALRLTQVFYHLGELDSALTYALGAGSYFDVNENSEYVRTLVGEQGRGSRFGMQLGAVVVIPNDVRQCAACCK